MAMVWSENCLQVPEPWYLDAHDLILQPTGEHKFTMSLV